MPQTKNRFFDGTEFVNDILGKMPEAMDILLSHGLGCAGCQFNMFETLEQGVLGHGFAHEDLDRILADLNEAAEDLGLSSNLPSAPSFTKRDDPSPFIKRGNKRGISSKS
jgi:hybrid cluster-associated redox disulfide protein